jgi:hypothetical protein
VFVVDAKNYTGRLEVRDAGTWLRADERLYVNGRDRSRHLLDGIERQVRIVRDFVPAAVPVRGVLCFVGENWRLLFPRPLHVRGTVVLWPAKLVEHLGAPEPVPPEEVAEITRRLSVALPTA